MKNIYTFVREKKYLQNFKISLVLFFGLSGSNAFGQTTQIFTASGSFTVPQGVTSLTVDCIGAGGSGGSGRSGFWGSNAGAGGGAGGQYAKSTITVTAGQVYTVKVAGVTAAPTNRNTNGNIGDFSAITFGATTIARANGGNGGIRANDSRAGGIGNAIGATGNIVTRSGGNGGTGTNSASGGGGGGAGTTGNGGNAGGATSGTGATLFGGSGAAGQANTSPGLAGKNYGGGGSGARRSNVGGAGAQGYVQISFTCATITSNAGTDQTLAACATTVTLAATAPTNGTGIWSVVSGFGTITTPSSRTSGVTGIVPGTPLVLRWAVSNGSCGSAFDDVTVTSPVGPACINPYCIPNPSSIDGTGITRVAIGGSINNTATRVGLYNNYTSLIEPVVQASNVTFLLRTATSGYRYYYEVWVDWNNDSDFDDYNEEMDYGFVYSDTDLNSSFDVPLNAQLGNHRLRIGIRDVDWPTTCYTGRYAQYEDYTLNVTALCTTGTPSSLSGATFINGLGSTGTLNDVVSNASAGYSPGGYKNNTAITLATQIPYGPVNLDIDVTGPDASFIYVFVDWNNNDNFNDPGETVYSTTNPTTGFMTATGDTSFGFIVPSGQAAGNYKMRVRTSPYYNTYPGSGLISPCDPGYFSGEAEDFTLKVVEDCPSKIAGVIPGSSCGPGEVTLGATSPGATQFKWYDAKKGGTLLHTTTIGSWTISSVSTTTTYYVTSFNGVCESLYRTPVVATVFPVADISFTPTAPEICGTNTVIALSASGDSSIDDLFVENFETGTLGKFSANQIKGSVSSAPWTVKKSSYIPDNTTVFKPAINSGGAGTSGNYFAFTTSDLAANNTTTSGQALETTISINTNGYTSLTLTFDQYYSHYDNDNVYLQVSQNGGAYTTVVTYNIDDGKAGDFLPKTIDFTPYINVTSLKFRLRYDALWDDGYAVDNFRLYGTKPLTSNFDWGENDGTMYTDEATTVLYVSHVLVPTIYIKPDITSGATFNYSAETTLPNGCLVTANIPVTNNTKVSTGVSTNWNSTNWLPDNVAPTSSKCVVVRNDVTLGAGNVGAAKNLTIEGTGKLTISGNLTVTDFIKNETTPLATNESNLILQSDANLMQINSGASNSGRMTAERSVTDMDNLLDGPGAQMDYVYWSSPVALQNLQTFSPGTPPNRIFEYKESTDFFVQTYDGVFLPGKGYAIRAEVSAMFPAQTAGYNKTYAFVGKPNNGDLSVPIKRSVNSNGNVHGYNLIGNPYPSNINFDELYAANATKIYQTAWLWNNTFYQKYQNGPAYNGNNYAIYNRTGGNSAPVIVGGTTAPNGIIKVGQGFIVQSRGAENSTSTLEFKNNYGGTKDLRVSTAGTFYQKNSESKNRFWLTLESPDHVLNSLLIGYIPGATDGFEIDCDAEAFNLSSDLFYSLLDNKNLLIQGKSAQFTREDRIKLGANFFQNANYTIALDDAEGIFANGQNIYLKDNQNGTITNLSEGAYVFSANKGQATGRFEIVYRPEIVLVTDAKTKEDLIVYRDGDDFVIRSPKIVRKVEVYDGSGKLIRVLSPNKKQTVLDVSAINNGMYILKITTADGVVANRKILR